MHNLTLPVVSDESWARALQGMAEDGFYLSHKEGEGDGALETFYHAKLSGIRPELKDGGVETGDYILEFEDVPGYYLLSRVMKLFHPRQNELRRDFCRQQVIQRVGKPEPVNSGVSGSVFGSGL